ncbi:dihydrofolate reductase [Hirschia maritima]|uniref:dihydrofolate reductase n=1 Tax=Hirschia maritima TaxID=1121961 RepID=UPI00037A3CBB|nr:dihydrofolate reductase [Hirschia maritima]
MSSTHNSEAASRPKLAMIVARASNGVIGVDGDLPWRLKGDLQFFKSVTYGKPVIMGRKTWESLPFKPLKGRANLVVTRQHEFDAPKARVYPSLGVAISAGLVVAEQTNVDEVMIIGGGAIYQAAFEQVDVLYVTDVDAAPEGDTFFPVVSDEEWECVEETPHSADSDNDHAFVMKKLVRKRS